MLSPAEAVIRVGATVMLRSATTSGCLSVSVDTPLPGEAPHRMVSCSTGGPSARTAITLCSYHDEIPEGGAFTYGSKVVLEFGTWGCALGSACPSTTTLGAQLNGKQETYAADRTRSGDFAWMIQPADYSQRMPMQGAPVDPAAPFVLVYICIYIYIYTYRYRYGYIVYIYRSIDLYIT